MEDSVLEKLSDLPNIGKEVEKQLNEIGIDTYDQLKEIGAKTAWIEIKKIDESACINRLYALEGAILKIRKTLLSDDKKAELKEFYNLHK